jgi:hypothetical protein
MDYCLDAGDGTASIWTAPLDLDADGDGELDATRLDLDGDGLHDDALIDLDGDGRADHASYDLDPARPARALYTDDGTGTWTLGGAATGEAVRWFGLDGVQRSGLPADVDADGTPEMILDIDRDGLADRALRPAPGGSPAAGYVDTDGDGRWDVVLRDDDGDGAADGAAGIG